MDAQFGLADAGSGITVTDSPVGTERGGKAKMNHTLTLVLPTPHLQVDPTPLGEADS